MKSRRSEKYSKENLQSVIKDSFSYSQVMRKLGLASSDNDCLDGHASPDTMNIVYYDADSVKRDVELSN